MYNQQQYSYIPRYQTAPYQTEALRYDNKIPQYSNNTGVNFNNQSNNIAQNESKIAINHNELQNDSVVSATFIPISNNENQEMQYSTFTGLHNIQTTPLPGYRFHANAYLTHSIKKELQQLIKFTKIVVCFIVVNYIKNNEFTISFRFA